MHKETHDGRMPDQIADTTSTTGNCGKRAADVFALMICQHEIRERISCSIEVVHAAIVP